MLRYLVGLLPFTKGGSKTSWKLKEGGRRFLLKETVPLEMRKRVTVQNKRFYSNFNRGLSCMFFVWRSLWNLTSNIFSCEAFITHIYYMFWYLKSSISIEGWVLLNKTSLCSKTWFVGPGSISFNTESNYYL